MSLLHLIRHGLSMPLHVAAAKAVRMAGRMLRDRLMARMIRNQCTYPPFNQVGGRLVCRLGPVDATAQAATLRNLAAQYRAHRFDLLGSGWVSVAHGARFAGFGPHLYGPGRKLGRNWRRDIAARHHRGNQVAALALLSQIEDEGYRPIDWHVDFKCGYRWSERTWGTSTPYAHKPGVDVKVPWELGRLQHLPQLALVYSLDKDAMLVREFRNQMLDFLAANPPGWGVNWACAMDVAIRAVNILVARDLFLAHGAAFDNAFEDELGSTILAHARHLASHLEWNEHHRGNHYLADICGLAWVAAYLPASVEADTLLVFATQQLAVEIERQFDPDGSNFEASTAYHRLSGEMALYTVALILGLPEDRRRAFATYDHRLWRHHPAMSPGPMAWPPFSADSLQRLARAARFARDVTKPSGEIVQIGDNDSGRFLKLAPSLDGGLRERILDLGHLVAAAKGLFDLDPASPPEASAETEIVAMLAGGIRLPAAVAPAEGLAGSDPQAPATRLTRVVLVPADAAALNDLVPVAYPDFGLFIWKNARAFVSVRCGPIGQNGNGGHAHNDQLAVEIEIDGVSWARDPGTFVYTPDLTARNAYRSIKAHFAPRHGDAEPAALVAPFRLADTVHADAISFGAGGFLGTHDGFGTPIYRRVLVQDGAIIVEDGWGGPAIAAATLVDEHIVRTPADLAALWGLTLPFSPGYGVTD